MKRAELIVTTGGWSHASTQYILGFEAVDVAKGEFDRIAALLKKRGDKGNDTPTVLDVQGSAQEFSCNFDLVIAIGLVDLKKADDENIGLKDEYPHLNWKP